MANPAQRLHDVLTQFRPYSNSGKPISEVWPDIFHLAEPTESQILFQIAEFLEFPDRVRSQVQEVAHEMPAELLLEWVPKLQNAFENFGPTHAVSGFASRITDDLLYGLRVCGALLDKHSPEKLISADELTKFNTQAKELREEVLNSSIEKELKDFITSRLGDVIIAINAFPITGVAGLERSFERILGSMVNHPGTWEKVGSTSVGRKVFKYIKNLGVILTFAWTAFQIGDRVQHYLDDDASDDESVTNHVAPAQEPRSSTPRPRHKRNIEI